MINQKEMKLSDEQMKKLQMTELEMVVEIDRICRKYDISYVLGAGSMLGAVRNKGFIPWDDDADIYMLRDEYEKFKEVCKKDLNSEKFFLQNWENDPYFNSGYAKMRRNNTKYVRVGQEKMKYHNGIYVDILILDNVPDKPKERYQFLNKTIVFRKILYAQAGAMCEKKWYKRFGYRILSFIPREWVKKRFDLWMRKYNNMDALFCRCLGALGRKVYCRSIFSERVECEFEGHKLYIPSNYHCFLKVCYGNDYMTPPPVEERVQKAPVSYIEFAE